MNELCTKALESHGEPFFILLVIVSQQKKCLIVYACAHTGILDMGCPYGVSGLLFRGGQKTGVSVEPGRLGWRVWSFGWACPHAPKAMVGLFCWQLWQNHESRAYLAPTGLIGTSGDLTCRTAAQLAWYFFIFFSWPLWYFFGGSHDGFRNTTLNKRSRSPCHFERIYIYRTAIYIYQGNLDQCVQILYQTIAFGLFQVNLPTS